MSIARRIKNNRSNANFGSFGSIDPAMSASDGINVPTLKLTFVAYYYDIQKPIYLYDGKEGKWLQKGFNARKSEDCTFVLLTEGLGKAIVFGTFRDSSGKMQYLFARRVKAGEFKVKVKIPFAALPDLRFGVAKKMDSRVGTEHLTDKELVGLTSNMLLINETKDSYVTKELAGFSGLGAVSRFTDNYTGLKSSDPSHAAAADGNNLKTASGVYKLWNGKLSDHRWHKHGYTGRKEKDATTRGGKNIKTEDGPMYTCDETGYYAQRASTYLMRYDKNGNQLGYDAMENRYDRFGNLVNPITAMPAGVPVAMVGQFFVHDPPSTAGWLAGGPNQGYGDLGVVHSKKSRKKYKKAYNSAKKATVKTLETVGDAVVDTYEAGKNFVEDPSLTALVSIVTAPFGMNTCWHYADKVTINKSNIFFVPKGMVKKGATSPSGETLPVTYAEMSAIPYEVSPQMNVKAEYTQKSTHQGKTVPTVIKKKDYAVLVEWYDPKNKKWTSPSKHPPFSPKTDKEGKFMLIFRFPRQLDPVSDRNEIQEGIKNGMADYSWKNANIKYAYPYPKRNKNTGKYEKAYNLLGRMEMKDSDTEMRRTYTQELGGQTYTGRMFLDYELMIKPPKHGRTYSEKSPDYMVTDSFSVRIADPAKFAYLANPEIDYATYIDGELKPGSVVLVMGKGLGSITGSNCILTMKGWPSGPPTPEDIAKLGTAVPAGHTPRWVFSNLLKPNNHAPRTVVDGSAAGTSEVDYLEFMGHITADDLLDDKLVSGEQVLIDTWKRCFNLDLNADWFRKKAASGNKLEGTDPANPLHYIVKGDKGEEYSFPFSIAWFKLPQYWVGPYLDYNEQGRLQELEGKPYAISREDQMMYIIQATPTGHVLQTKLDIVTETTEQKELLEAGYPLGPALNQMNFDPSDVSETAALDEREREWLRRTGRTHPHDKPPKKYRYTNNIIKAKLFNWDNDRVMKPDPTKSLGAFTNSSNFYAEDITEKWGETLDGYAGPQLKEEDTAMLPLGAIMSLGSAADEIVGAGEDLKDAATGASEEAGWIKFVADAGMAAGKATGNAVVGITESISDADLSVGETVTVIGVATTAAIALGLGAIYFGPSGLAKVPGALYKGFK